MVYLKAHATANTEKTTLSYSHENQSCQSCTLLKWGKNSGFVTRRWKLYRKVLDRLCLYHGRNAMIWQRQSTSGGLHSHEISSLHQGETVSYFYVCELRK